MYINDDDNNNIIMFFYEGHGSTRNVLQSEAVGLYVGAGDASVADPRKMAASKGKHLSPTVVPAALRVFRVFV